MSAQGRTSSAFGSALATPAEDPRGMPIAQPLRNAGRFCLAAPVPDSLPVDRDRLRTGASQHPFPSVGRGRRATGDLTASPAGVDHCSKSGDCRRCDPRERQLVDARSALSQRPSGGSCRNRHAHEPREPRSAAGSPSAAGKRPRDPRPAFRDTRHSPAGVRRNCRPTLGDTRDWARDPATCRGAVRSCAC